MTVQLPGQLELFPREGMHVTEVYSFVLPWLSERGRDRSRDQVWWRWRCSCGDSAERREAMSSHEDGAERSAEVHRGG